MAKRSPLYGFEWVALASAGALFLFYFLTPVWQPFWIITLGTIRLFGILVLLSLLFLLVFGVMKDPKNLWKKVSHFNGQTVWWTLDYVRMGISLAVVETAHFILKVHIPLITHLNYDPLFWRMDRWIFGGVQPQRIIHVLIHCPTIIRFLDLLYSSLYYFIVWGSVLLFLTALTSKDRLRFMTSFCLFWQIGLILYIILPSWGPIFTQSAFFQETMRFMPHTYHVQSQLWQETAHIIRHDFNFTIQFFGCAAFPSLHVGLLFLYALWSLRLKRVFRWLFFILLALMALGSVVSGYHYAVDILGGLFVAWLAYRLCSRNRTSSGLQP